MCGKICLMLGILSCRMTFISKSYAIFVVAFCLITTSAVFRFSTMLLLPITAEKFSHALCSLDDGDSVHAIRRRVRTFTTFHGTLPVIVLDGLAAFYFVWTLAGYTWALLGK